MNRKPHWTDWIKKAPNWLKTSIGIISAIITLIILLRPNLQLGIVVIIGSMLLITLGVSIYIIFSKDESPILGGGQTDRYPKYRKFAIILAFFTTVLLLIPFTMKNSRDYVTTAILGTATPAFTLVPPEEAILKIVDVSVVDRTVVDFKLKNSGTDSAFLKRIEFVFRPGVVLKAICDPKPATVYEFTLDASMFDEAISISPDFQYLDKNDVEERIRQIEESEFYTADEKKKLVEKLQVRLEEINSGKAEMEIQDQTKELVTIPNPSSTHETDNNSTRFSTSRSKPLSISQVVPPKGVDRFQIEFQIPQEALDGGCSPVYRFEGFAIIYYDENSAIETPPFTIIFGF